VLQDKCIWTSVVLAEGDMIAAQISVIVYAFEAWAVQALIA
jgi:hypothetical protein